MAGNLKNNLFHYATRELSQDAFMCWLMSYAYEGCENIDPELTKCAKRFLREFTGVDSAEADTFVIEKIKTQKHVTLEAEKEGERNRGGSIDILLTANDKALNKKHIIVIEDKIHASEGDGQLEKYKKALEKENTEDSLKFVYLKTGFQANMINVKNAGYTVVDRKTILKILGTYKSENAIFTAFYDYWTNFENETQEFKEKPVGEWGWMQVYGFYEYLHKTRFEDWKGRKVEYAYVPNPSGGFDGMWIPISFVELSFPDEKVPCELYLQIETIPWNAEKEYCKFNICYKVNIFYELGATESREKMNKIENCVDIVKQKLTFDKSYGDALGRFNKPARLGHGKTMTLGIYDFVQKKKSEPDFGSFRGQEDYLEVMRKIKDAEMQIERIAEMVEG